MRVDSSIKSAHSTELSAVMLFENKHSIAMVNLRNVVQWLVLLRFQEQ